MTRRRVVLLGDSILDNLSYTAPEPDTTAHLRRLLGTDWQVVLLASDGAVMSDMSMQLQELDAADVGILSIGGNDATRFIGELTRPAQNAADTIARLLAITDEFAARYQEVVRRVAGRVDRLVLCTIYEVRLRPAPLDQLARVPIALLCDRIIATGRALGLEVIDLRAVCTEDEDFVLEIEPSPRGARRIAEAIAASVRAAAR